MSPPCGWCGLKSLSSGTFWAPSSSPPCGWCGLKSFRGFFRLEPLDVTTLRVVWIEICIYRLSAVHDRVTTLRVVWIEIPCRYGEWELKQSPPCGWCGLKFRGREQPGTEKRVTTLRVVWIEIRVEINIVYIHGVTTLRVVWIEISVTLAHSAGKFCHHLAGGVD